jgi:hypothetical protein
MVLPDSELAKETCGRWSAEAARNVDVNPGVHAQCLTTVY